MIYCVRGPTRWRGLVKMAVWLGLIMGAGCASDPSMEELDEAVGDVNDQEESVNMADDSYADNESNENIYNDLNVEQASQSENYSYDNLDGGENDNISDLENNLAENSYNLDDEQGYGYEQNAQTADSYNNYGDGNYGDEMADNAGEYDDQYSGDSYANVQADDYQAVLDEPVGEGYNQSSSDMLSDNTYGDAINSYNNSSQAIAALDAESVALNESMADPAVDYGTSMDATAAGGAMSGYQQVGLPEYGSKMNYLVQQGDTLGSIATLIYGDQDRWQEIQLLTGLSNPDLIYPGDVVYYLLTEESQAFAAAYENTAKGEVTVAQGDTLSMLAQSIYGDHSQWKTLWRANDTIDDPDHLTVGQIVYFVDYQSVMAAKSSWQGYFAQHVNVDVSPVAHMAEDRVNTAASASLADLGLSVVNGVGSSIQHLFQESRDLSLTAIKSAVGV